MRSLSDVANCARWVYSPVCVKCVKVVRAASGQISRIVGTSTEGSTFRFKSYKIKAMGCKKSYDVGGVILADTRVDGNLAEGMSPHRL
jgi:hypothetical protein